MKIFTATQLKELDAYTMKHEPIASIDLMERAATEMCEYLKEQIYDARRIVVFAGPGNNGGDALVVARLLAKYTSDIAVYLFNTGNKLSANCEINRDRLKKKSKVEFIEVTSQFEPPKLTANDIIIDGLFGIGLNKPLSGGFASLVKYINASSARVYSIDVPSGLMCENNSDNRPDGIVRADVTLSIGQPKLAFYFADTAACVGKIVDIDINHSQEYIDMTAAAYSTSESDEIYAMRRKRNRFGHKGTFGHGLLIAGSYGMAGAAVLAAKACLRSGVGKVTVHTPRENNTILQIAVPEAVLSHDAHDRFFTAPVNTEAYSAVAIGPGLGTNESTELAFIEQVRHVTVPLVIDADGINILARHKGWIAQLPKGTILTPHPGEFVRLTGTKPDGYSMLEAALGLAIHNGLYIVLKGHHTLICTPEGHTYINTTGNSGMATAGSGDVLTGVLLSLLAQGYPPEEACRFGVYIHGGAGDRFALRNCETSLIASDIINYLGSAITGDKWPDI